MSDSNKNVVTAARKNMVSEDEQESFNFMTLPYVCQKRLGEILDAKTLNTFSKINSTTRNLSKRCHIIEKAVIENDDMSECKYTISCFCTENEFCRGIHETDLLLLKKKIDVHWVIKLGSLGNDNVKIDARYLQSLPFTFDSNEVLGLVVHCIKLEDLKMIIPPGLKQLGFAGGIESDCSMKVFMDFIKSLTQLDFFQFTLIHYFSTLSFNIDDLASEGAELLSQKIITEFEADDDFTTFRNF